MPVCHLYYFLRGKDIEMDLEISLQATSYGQHPKKYIVIIYAMPEGLTFILR